MQKSVGLRKKYVYSKQTLSCLEGLALLVKCGFEVVGCLEHKQSFTEVPGFAMPVLVKHHLRLNYARRERWASKQALPRDAALGTP